MFEIKEIHIRYANKKRATPTNTVTIPAKWLREYGVKVEDALPVIFGRILVVIPPGLSEEEVEKIYKFVKRGEE